MDKLILLWRNYQSYKKLQFLFKKKVISHRAYDLTEEDLSDTTNAIIELLNEDDLKDYNDFKKYIDSIIKTMKGE